MSSPTASKALARLTCRSILRTARMYDAQPAYKAFLRPHQLMEELQAAGIVVQDKTHSERERALDNADMVLFLVLALKEFTPCALHYVPTLPTPRSFSELVREKLHEQANQEDHVLALYSKMRTFTTVDTMKAAHSQFALQLGLKALRHMRGHLSAAAALGLKSSYQPPDPPITSTKYDPWQDIQPAAAPIAGLVLLAHPLHGGSFKRCVVLLCEYDFMGGAVGLIINQPSQAQLQSIINVYAAKATAGEESHREALSNDEDEDEDDDEDDDDVSAVWSERGPTSTSSAQASTSGSGWGSPDQLTQEERSLRPFASNILLRGGPIPTLQMLHAAQDLGGLEVLTASTQPLYTRAVDKSACASGPDVFMGGHLKRALPLLDKGKLKPNDLHFFAGECKWLPQQLEQELRAGVWLMARVPPQLLFPWPSTTESIIGQPNAWQRILRAMGGEYAAFADIPDQSAQD
eukprot:jgi/Chlat1/7899/Chrsp66S07206